MNLKINRVVQIIIIFSVILCAVSLFAANTSGTPLQGGDIQRNPALGLNFLGGFVRLGSQVEIECDIRLGSKMSLAPRLGLASFGWFAPGISIRFGIIEGNRPHGFWIGPGADFIFASTGKNKWWDENEGSQLLFALSGEFGYKYTFAFGLYLQALTRLGFVFAKYGSGFFWNLGLGIGYAF